MICERIADFLKHYLNNSKLWRIGDTLTRFSDNEQLEGERYFRILKINFICGLITAVIFKADLVMILKHPDEVNQSIGWGNWQYYSSTDKWFLGLGLIMTALFISFGSKFWHDLLDLLLQVKNYKRVMADPEIYRADKIGNIEKRPLVFQSDFINGAFLEARSLYEPNPNVKAFALLYNKNGYYFEITLQENDSRIPAGFVYRPSEGAPVTIPIEKILLGSSEIRAQALNLGSKIANSDDLKNFGTLGCLVQKAGSSKDTKYILTCYHSVVEPDKLFGSKLENIDVQSPDLPGINIGKPVLAERSLEIDGALIKVNNDQVKAILNELPERLGKPEGIRQLTNEDVEKGVDVFMYGAVSEFRHGKLLSVYVNVVVKYADTEFKLHNLLAIARNGMAISQKGDSGACVLDGDNKLLGLIVAGSDTVSYAIPATTLFNFFNVTLIND